MNLLLVRKNRHDRIIVCCQMCPCATLADNLSQLFVALCSILCSPYAPSMEYLAYLCSQVFLPYHMPLFKMACLILQHMPLVGGKKVSRTVCISLKRHLVYVSLTVPAWVRNCDVLTALAYYGLSNSPELKKLPRWMKREIRRRGRCIRPTSTSMAYVDACVCPMEDIGITECRLISKLASKAEIVSVKRCLLWKGCHILAKSITAEDVIAKSFLGRISRDIKSKEDILSVMHPMCSETAVWIEEKNYVLSVLVKHMLAALEKRYPCFFCTKAGHRILVAAYAGVGIMRILWNVCQEIRYLSWDISLFCKGTWTPVSFSREGTVAGLLEDTQAGLSDGSSPDDGTSSGMDKPSQEADAKNDAGHPGAEKDAPEGKGEEDTAAAVEAALATLDKAQIEALQKVFAVIYC